MKTKLCTLNITHAILVVIVVLLSVAIPVIKTDKAGAGQISDSEINNFCNIWVWGFYDFMYINNGSSNITITVPSPAITQVDITYTNEIWFCRDRPIRPHTPLDSSWGLRSDNYRIVEEGSSFNRLVSPSTTSQTKWPDSAVRRTTSNGHKEMVVSTNTARLDVTGWTNGSVHRVCTEWGVTSYNSAPVYEPVDPHCINVTIRHDWQLNAASSAVISSPTPLPGDTITWSHSLRNNGPGSTTGNITSSIGTSANFANGWGSSIAQTVVSSPIAPNIDIRTFPIASRTYTIQPSDAGKTLCQWVNYTPTNSWGGTNGQSTPACVTVAYDYQLIPDVSGPATIQPGQDVNFTYNVDLTGLTISGQITPSVKQYIVGPGASFSYPIVENVGDCGTSVYGSCPDSEWSLAPRVITTSGSISSPSSSPMSTVGIPDGSLVCQILSVSPAGFDGLTSAQTANRWSEPHCAMIARVPYVKIFNGDAVAGALFENFANPLSSCTGTSSGTIKTYSNPDNTGSGAQIAAFAAGVIDQFVSASGQSPSVPTGWPAAPRLLSFANTTSSSFGGEFLGYPCIPDFWAGAGASPTTGNITVSSANIPSTDRTVTYIEGNAYVGGDIEYNGWNIANSWQVKNNTGNTNVPSYWLVVKGDIYISPGVSRLDGVYVALPDGSTGGKIYTCALGFTVPTSAQIANNCGTQLQVNGAFIADEVKLLRTINSLGDSTVGESLTTTNAAEVFNFSPEVWLSSPIPLSQNQIGKYDSILSLPPVL